MSKIMMLQDEIKTLDDAIVMRLNILSSKLSASLPIGELEEEAAKTRQLLDEWNHKVDLLNKARAEEI